MDEEILEGLNPQQRQAVTTTEGPLLVLAGAGSGKTSVLTRRIAWILEKGLAARHQILAVTFTNKAAREMAERIEGLCGDGHFRNMGTFHSVCSRWLRREADYLGIPSNFSIYDTSAQLSVMKACLKELAISEKEYTPRTLLSHVSRCKNYSTPLSELQRGNKFEQAVALVYPRYNKKLLDNSALDFDDILVYAVKLFKENPEVLEKYSDMIRYVLVDEYQDVNPVQYELLRLISGKRRNFCAVGDDDQSIYGFRGADVSIILRFRDDFPDAGIIKLEQNYRSTQSILDAANALVSHNYGRMDKAMWCSSGDGTKPKVYQAMNGEEEALFVASEIRKLEKSGCKRSDIAVLYRTNAQSRVFEEVFMKRGIAHDLVGGMKFYERKEIKDLLAFLNIIANNNDTISLGRILELLPGVGEKTRDKIVQYAVTHRIAFYMALQFGDEAGLRPAQAKAVKDIFGNLERLHEKAYAGVPVRVLLDDILTFTDYKYSILKNDDPETESRRENIDELVAVVSEFDAGNEDDGVPLELFLQSVSLMSDQDTMLEDPDKVSMMTLHTSKGLEFPVVFLAGLEEDSLPHYRAAQDGSVTEIDEERRLCYVGMTRAKKLLYLSFATLRNQFGQIFSR
ncbi:MAG: UvrD-helicase domain-containing protein, partial [bacterium]|nr:UvrD-helicase domain-containing protein [bacterium]